MGISGAYRYLAVILNQTHDVCNNSGGRLNRSGGSFQTCAKNHKDDAAQTLKNRFLSFGWNPLARKTDCNEGKLLRQGNVVYPVFVSGIQPVILRLFERFHAFFT
ncbi:MAG: hypothetical protein IPK21_20180 [Haliscomenobacter sp.]|nr:hypothetical protein [Haliscomenobacter sp.]